MICARARASASVKMSSERIFLFTTETHQKITPSQKLNESTHDPLALSLCINTSTSSNPTPNLPLKLAFTPPMTFTLSFCPSATWPSNVDTASFASFSFLYVSRTMTPPLSLRAVELVIGPQRLKMAFLEHNNKPQIYNQTTRHKKTTIDH